jgi:glycosyltransferase involved in cell wall biosynthesis
MIKIMHIITTLGPGGAETMLSRVVSGMDGTQFENEVVSLRGVLDLAERIQAMGVRVRTLGMKRSVPNPLLVMRLAQWIRESKPHVIHSWMYHSNLVGTLAARLAGHVPLVWGIRHSALNPRIDRRRTILVDRACAFLSKEIPARIVCCSEVSQQIHKRLGYAAEKLEIIPNGFDLEQFKPDPTARVSLRRELGIPAGTPLIGIAARFHPHKDHWNFLQAAARLHKQIPESHFLLCGLDITWQNQQLAGWIQAVGLRDCCHLLGVRRDMSRLFAGVDIATLSSLTEAFPSVIGEAMACGTPCVVTDVGDSALIVGETGRVVAPGDPDALAEAWRKLIEAGPGVRHRLGMAARTRVQQYFTLRAVVEHYQAIYTQLADGTLQGVPATGLSQSAREISPV